MWQVVADHMDGFSFICNLVKNKAMKFYWSIQINNHIHIRIFNQIISRLENIFDRQLNERESMENKRWNSCTYPIIENNESEKDSI